MILSWFPDHGVQENLVTQGLNVYHFFYLSSFLDFVLLNSQVVTQYFKMSFKIHNIYEQISAII